MMWRRCSWGESWVLPRGPSLRAGAPEGCFLFSLRGLKSSRNRSAKANVLERFTGRLGYLSVACQLLYTLLVRPRQPCPFYSRIIEFLFGHTNGPILDFILPHCIIIHHTLIDHDCLEVHDRRKRSLRLSTITDGAGS